MPIFVHVCCGSAVPLFGTTFHVALDRSSGACREPLQSRLGTHQRSFPRQSLLLHHFAHFVVFGMTSNSSLPVFHPPWCRFPPRTPRHLHLDASFQPMVGSTSREAHHLQDRRPCSTSLGGLWPQMRRGRIPLLSRTDVRFSFLSNRTVDWKPLRSVPGAHRNQRKTKERDASTCCWATCDADGRRGSASSATNASQKA